MLAAAVKLVTLWVSGCERGIQKQSVLGIAELELIFTIAAPKILPMILFVLFVITDGFTILQNWASQHISISFFCPSSSSAQFLVAEDPDKCTYATSRMFFRGSLCRLLKSLCEWREIWNFYLAFAKQLWFISWTESPLSLPKSRGWSEHSAVFLTSFLVQSVLVVCLIFNTQVYSMWTFPRRDLCMLPNQLQNCGFRQIKILDHSLPQKHSDWEHSICCQRSMHSRKNFNQGVYLCTWIKWFYTCQISAKLD